MKLRIKVQCFLVFFFLQLDPMNVVPNSDPCQIITPLQGCKLGEKDPPPPPNEKKKKKTYTIFKTIIKYFAIV